MILDELMTLLMQEKEEILLMLAKIVADDDRYYVVISDGVYICDDPEGPPWYKPATLISATKFKYRSEAQALAHFIRNSSNRQRRALAVNYEAALHGRVADLTELVQRLKPLQLT